MLNTDILSLLDSAGYDESNFNFAFQSDSLPFPQKLYALLQEESKSARNIVSWLPNGMTFKIFDTDRFEIEVIPKYFKRKCLIYF